MIEEQNGLTDPEVVYCEKRKERQINKEQSPFGVEVADRMKRTALLFGC